MFIRSIALFFLVVVNVQATPKIQHWQTDNGARVYFVEAHELPMVDVQVVFDAGSSRDKNKPGLSVLTNGLLAEGANGLSADVISQNFDKRGAIFSSSVSYDSATVGLRSVVDKDKLQPALENFKQVITQPDFPEDALERQRNRLLVGIRHKQQSPGKLASDAFYAAVYEDHPYASPNEGTVDSVKQITREDVSGFYTQYYVAANAVIAIVGDLDRKQAEKLVNDLLGDLETGEKAKELPDVASLTEAKIIRIDHPSVQTHILVGQTGIRRGDPDYFALYVGNHVLGGGGMVSRLFKEIREKRGLSYSSYSYFYPMRKPGPFTAGLQTKSEQAQDALDLLNKQLVDFINNGPTEEELIASKKNITGGFPLRIDSNSKIIGYLGMIGFYNLPLNYLDTFNENVEAVTTDQIKDAFKRRLAPDKFVTVTVGPRKEKAGEKN